MWIRDCLWRRVSVEALETSGVSVYGRNTSSQARTRPKRESWNEDIHPSKRNQSLSCHLIGEPGSS